MAVFQNRIVRWGAGVTLSLGVATAAIGFLHTSAGRPLLARLGGCPVGTADPAAVQSSTEASILSTRGQGRAAARPALGFRLDADTYERVMAWSVARDLSCHGSRENTVLKCQHVAASALPDATDARGVLDEMVFGFRASDGTLWSVAGWTYGGGARDASERLAIAAGSLERVLGAPQQRAGDVAALARGESGAPSVAYRFEDYLADVSGSSVAGRITFRQQYTSGTVLGRNVQAMNR